MAERDRDEAAVEWNSHAKSVGQVVGRLAHRPTRRACASTNETDQRARAYVDVPVAHHAPTSCVDLWYKHTGRGRKASRAVGVTPIESQRGLRRHKNGFIFQCRGRK